MKKFLIVDCDYGEKWREMPFSQMFERYLSCPGDEWSEVAVDKGEVLPLDNILEYDGVVITGSRHNCRDGDSLPWFNDVCDMINLIYDNGSPRLYGGCFGCQIIAHALGGIVDCNPTGEFLLKAENISFITHVPLTGESERTPSGTLKVLVSHGDCVRSLPPCANLIAVSSSCACEVYSCGKSTHNILACQSHPEFDYEYCIRDRIWPSITSSGRISEEHQVEYSETFVDFSREQGSDELIDVIKRFLHGY